MKKILCITESLAGGGAEHQMAILCNLLYEKGYDVSLVTYADVPDHYAVNDGIKRIRLGVGKSSFRTVFSIFWYFIRVKTDCIISYRQACNARVLLPLFLRRKNIKVICGERNLSLKEKTNNFERFLFTIGYNRADYIVPNSYSQSKFLTERCPSWESKIKTIINYTDIEQFKMANMPSDDTVIKIAVFARFSSQKNAPRFVQMLYQLKNKSSKPFHVDWYGYRGKNGNDPNYLKIQNLISEYNIDDVISLLPPVKNPALTMNNYHAICLPSLFEGFSNSIAEGICSGKPMLVSDVSDNSLMVHDEVNGFLFDPTSTESMKEAFLKFFSTSKEMKKEMGLNSRQIAEKLFDADIFIQKYIDLIES